MTALVVDEGVHVPVPGGAALDGDIAIPEGARGLIVFAHGSGSSRHSPRNRVVASGLQDRGFGTLLMDLLTLEEEAIDLRTRDLRFDIDLLAERMVATSTWLAEQTDTQDLRLGYFGASTGGAAALVAAARQPDRVDAVVSRGGRPDLAGDHLAAVTAPTLLLVGGRDEVVLGLNREATSVLGGTWRLVVIPGATHLFEEPGALEEVTRRAGDWFVEYVGGV